MKELQKIVVSQWGDHIACYPVSLTPMLHSVLPVGSSYQGKTVDPQSYYRRMAVQWFSDHHDVWTHTSVLCVGDML